MRYHVIDRWHTVASNYPRCSIGDWEISTREQTEGVYKMQDIGEFYYVPGSIYVTVLKEGNKVWFTDEPRQMYALADIGLFRAFGHVVVGGLGLGLIHSFLHYNPLVTYVTTIEIAPELETLVWPHVRHWDYKLIVGDFYKELPKMAEQGIHVDTIILDFIFGYQDDRTWAELNKQREFCSRYYPNAQFLEHGYQGRMDEEVVHRLVPSTMSGVMYDQIKVVR